MLLEALSIHDRTLWLSKLSEAIVQFNEKDQQQKIKKQSGTKKFESSVNGTQYNGSVATFGPRDLGSNPDWSAVIKFKSIFV